MADGNPQIQPWPTIQPVWNTSPITQDFRRRWIAQFGDKRQAVRNPNGIGFLYPGAAGGARMTPPIPGSDAYHRATVAEHQGGAPTDREIPYAAQLREADQTPNDPFRLYRDNPSWSAPGVEGSLARAAAIDAYKNSHDVGSDQNARFQSLRTGSEIMSDMRTHLANVSDADISKLGQGGIDLHNFLGLNLDKPLPTNTDFLHLENWPGAYGAVGRALKGVNPNVIAFLNDVARARAAGFLAPPTGTASPGTASPLELIPSGGFKELLGLEALKTGGQALWDYLGKKENLTNLRNTLPQDLNKTNQLLYDTVAQDPQARWKQDQVDYANRIAAQPGFTHGGNPYSESKPIEAPDQSTSTLVNTPVVPLQSQPTSTTQPPQTQPSQTVVPGMPRTAPVTQPTPPSQQVQPQPQPSSQLPLGQRILQTLGHFFTGTLGQHGQPPQQPAPVAYYQQTQPAPAPVQVRRAQPVQPAQPTRQANAPRATPSATTVGQIPERWGTPFVQGTLTRSQATAPVFSKEPLPPGFNSMTLPGWGTPANPTILPPAPGGRLPGVGTQGLEPELIYGTTSAKPTIHTDEQYASLNPGDQFTWGHDGNDYVKT